MSTNTYDFKKVSVIVNGTFVTGFMDGTPIKAEPNQDKVKPHVGAAGDVTYSEVNDNTGKITLTLKANSSSLSYLVGLAKQKTTFPVQIVDMNDNNFRAGGTEARILKTPGYQAGAELQGIEVSIHVADFDLK